MHPIKTPKKLIEVALPLDAINAAAAREKSIRHGHPSTLHLWWARRPLAAARAVIFAQMVNDPGYERHLGRGVNKEKAAAERERLFKIIEDLVLWENTNNEEVMERARAEIRKSWRETCALNKHHPQAAELFDPETLPGFHDPFAGGGALPLEAQRLGLESYASDLNPVAVTINKAMIEIPPKFAGRAPVFGSAGVSPAKNWFSRGYLPHLDHPGLIQFITFRLADAIPRDVLKRLIEEEADDLERSRSLERLLDHGYGECQLADPANAEIVQRALLHFNEQRYRLLAWVIMPNHVHVLIETLKGHGLSEIVHSWKSFTAKEINRRLGRTGELWQREYFDRYIRDERHLNATVHYIEQNPVKAGLVRRAEEWRYSGMYRCRESAGETPALPGLEDWSGARGLAEDVRRYGAWMREQAQQRIGHLYPPIDVTAEMVAERPDLAQYRGEKLTVIAWLWARTVKSPNPAFSHVEVPLVSTFILSSKAGKEAYVQPVIEGDSYRFEVRMGTPPATAKGGTTAGKRSAFICLLSGAPVDYNYIRAEGQAGRMGQRLMAVVAEGTRGRVYLSPTQAQIDVARSAQPGWAPEMDLPNNPRDFKTPNYGLGKFGDLFTPRQLVSLTTFSDLVQEAIARVREDALAAGMDDDGLGLDQSGTGATAYAQAVGVYLAFAISRTADRGSTICSWDSSPKMEALRNTFGRQAIPMTWDFAEGNPFSDSSGNWTFNIEWGVKAVQVFPAVQSGTVFQQDAQTQETSQNKLISTDPPYYDNIGYADLSDFFYVWLRRSLRPVFPNLYGTLAVPKAEELVATPYRHGSKDKAEAFFLDGMTAAMHNLAEQAHPAFPVTIYYAFKQAETKAEAGTSSTGWETFLAAVLKAGFALTGTWPMRTELGNRMIGAGTNALASSIVLVCRQRAADAPTISRREFIRELNATLPEALAEMTRGGINSPVAPVDLSQAIIGPGMEVFSKYSAVLEADGSPMSVRTALQLINRFVAEDDFDHDTQFCLAWFEQHGWAEGKYGDADVLARAKGTSVGGLVDAGVVESGGGDLRLLKWAEMPRDWSPETDSRVPIWEALHQLIRALNQDGETAAGSLLARMPDKTAGITALTYRLYTLCERQGWAEEARAYNELQGAWSGIEQAGQEAGHIGSQVGMDF